MGALIRQTVRIVDQSVHPMLYFVLGSDQTAVLVGKLWPSCLVVGDRFVPLYEDGLKVVGFLFQQSEFPFCFETEGEFS